MSGVGRIRFRDGALVMPARNGYDKEILFEEVEVRARRHGEATLEMNRREMLVRVAEHHRTDPCARCGNGMGLVAFDVGKLSFCRQCARKSLP